MRETTMKLLKMIAHKSLAAGELLRLPGGRGLALEVGRGMVWLTMPGRDDVLLEHGGRVALTRTGVVLAEAIGFAEVNVIADVSYAQRVRALLIGRLAERARQWFSRTLVRMAA